MRWRSAKGGIEGKGALGKRRDEGVPCGEIRSLEFRRGPEGAGGQRAFQREMAGRVYVYAPAGKGQRRFPGRAGSVRTGQTVAKQCARGCRQTGAQTRERGFKAVQFEFSGCPAQGKARFQVAIGGVREIP